MNFVLSDCYYCELDLKQCICADVEEFFFVKAYKVPRQEVVECPIELS